MHHGVRIQDSALVSAAVLSNRYLTNRFLPDKAIDLVDEAAQQAAHRDRLAADRDRRRPAAHPAARDRAGRAGEGDRRGVEGAARRAARRARHAQRRGRRDEAALGGREAGDRRHPHAEGGARGSCASQLERETDLDVAAEIRYGRIPELERRIDEATAHLDELQTGNRMLKEEVDAEDIAEVVAKWTGVPVSRLMEGEMAQARPPRGAPPPAGHRPGRRGHRRRQRDPAQPRRAVRPEPADRLVHVPRARPASARPSWPGRSPSSCSTTSRRWCASTWASTWRSSPSAASSARLPATSATTRAAS